MKWQKYLALQSTPLVPVMDAFSAPIYWADSEVRPMMSANPCLTKHQRQQTMCSHLYLIKASPAAGVVPASLNKWKSMFGQPTLAPLIQVGYSYSFCKIRFQKVVAINRDFWPTGIGLVCTQRQKKMCSNEIHSSLDALLSFTRLSHSVIQPLKSTHCVSLMGR